jgi:hypothetical protein
MRKKNIKKIETNLKEQKLILIFFISDIYLSKIQLFKVLLKNIKIKINLIQITR